MTKVICKPMYSMSDISLTVSCVMQIKESNTCPCQALSPRKL